MRRFAALLGAVAIAVALAAAGCAGEDDAPSDASDGAARTEKNPSPAAEDFYAVPDDIDRYKPGELIRHAEAKKTPNGVLHRVMYSSESLEGEAIAVTGLIGVPLTPAPPDGRPILGYAHWTTGMADECAPSRTIDGATEGLIDLFLGRGMVVAATDYEGLGTPGLHPYLVGESEGRGVLDAIRAAKSLPGAEAGNRAVVAGHSQGGHAAIFAAQVAKEWAPELDVRGAAAGAPPSEFRSLSATVGGGSTLGYFAMITAGVSAAIPSADLGDILTDDAIELLEIVERECTGAVLRAFSGKAASEIVANDPSSVPAWEEAIAAIDPGHTKSEVPLWVFHGADDELVPARGSEVLFERLCGLGQTIERKVYPGQNHGGVVTAALGDLLAWLDARLAGQSATSTCPAPVSD